MNPPGPVGMNRWNLTPHAWAVSKATLYLHSMYHVTETLQVLGTQGLAGVGDVSEGGKGRGLTEQSSCSSHTVPLSDPGSPSPSHKAGLGDPFPAFPNFYPCRDRRMRTASPHRLVLVPVLLSHYLLQGLPL